MNHLKKKSVIALGAAVAALMLENSHAKTFDGSLVAAEAFATMDVLRQASFQAYVSSPSVVGQSDNIGKDDVLGTVGLFKTGTARWFLESGAELADVALHFRSQDNCQMASWAAKLSLQRLQQAVQRFGSNEDPAVVASAHETQGILHERLLGDATSAERSYSKAFSLSPETGQAAALLARLVAVAIETQVSEVV